MKIIILILLSLEVFAQNAKLAPSPNAHFRHLEVIKRNKQVRTGQRNHSNHFLNEVLRSNKLLKKLLNGANDSIVIWEDHEKVLTGNTYKGMLLNSIVSTNLSSPVLVKSEEEPFLGAKFSCRGITRHKRVLTICDRMIWNNKEYEVSVQILNTDGTAGLLGTYDDGKDDLVVGAIASELAGGVIVSATDMSESSFTKYPKSNLKNHVINGAVRSTSKISEILLDDYKTKEPIVSVNSGKPVLIYFMEALK